MGNSSNRVRLAAVVETTRGVLPENARFRISRMTGESLKIDQAYVDSEEIRDDRMEADPVAVNATTDGTINEECYFPKNLSVLSEFIRSVCYNDWTLTSERDNDLTAGSAITAVTAAQFTLAAGPAFAAGNLVYSSGQALAANNGLFALTGGSATTAVAAGLSADAMPAGSARLKLVGQQGTAGDITATATGLGSTALDFTTLGLAPGRWLKLTGFATAANNAWVRIAGTPTATALPLDNLPVAWAADDGDGVTVQLFFGDQISNGIVERPVAIERTFLDQTTPTRILQLGMIADKWDIKIDSGKQITQSFDWMGMDGIAGTVDNGASYNPSITGRIMAANANVGGLNEAGVPFRNSNPVKSFELILSNGQTAIDDVESKYPVGTTAGSATVTGTIEVHFLTIDLLNKYLNSTPSAINARAEKDNQAVIFGCGHVTYNSDGQPNATARNAQITQKVGFKSTFDPLTNSQIMVDRFEYFQ